MVVDVILIAIFLLAALVGYMRGLIKMLADFLGTFVAGVLAYSFLGPFKSLLIKFTDIDEFVHEKVVEKLQEFGANAVNGGVSGSDLAAVEQMQLPNSVRDKLTEFLSDTTTGMAQNVSDKITDLIISVFSMAILFIILLLLIKVIVAALDLVSKLPVLNSLNRFGGVAFSLLSVYLIMTVVFMLFGTFNSIDAVSNNHFIEESVVAGFLIEYNPIFIMLANVHF